MSAWILWICSGTISSFVGGYSGPTYRADSGYDTKEECERAATAYRERIRAAVEESHLNAQDPVKKHQPASALAHTALFAPYDPECWPVGHDPNLNRSQGMAHFQMIQGEMT